MTASCDQRIPMEEDTTMRFCYRKLMLFAIRWLSRSHWGRRLIWTFMMRALRARVRRFLREIAELFPVFEPLAARA